MLGFSAISEAPVGDDFSAEGDMETIISAAGRIIGVSVVTATSEYIAVASGNCYGSTTVNASSAVATGGLSAGAAVTITLLPSPFIFELIPV